MTNAVPSAAWRGACALLRSAALRSTLLLLSLAGAAEARSLTTPHQLVRAELPPMQTSSGAPKSLPANRQVPEVAITKQDPYLVIAPATPRTCLYERNFDVITKLHVNPSDAVRALRGERIERGEAGPVLVLDDYWVDPSRGSVVAAGSASLPLTLLASEHGVEVFAFRDGQALEVLVATARGVVIDAQADAARCTHARARIAVSPKDGGVLRFVAVQLRPDAELDAERRISEAELFRRDMLGFNVTISLSQLSRDKAPLLSTVVGPIDDNTAQFVPSFLSWDTLQLLQKFEQEQVRSRKGAARGSAASRPKTKTNAPSLVSTTRPAARSAPPAKPAAAPPARPAARPVPLAKPAAAPPARPAKPPPVPMRFRPSTSE